MNISEKKNQLKPADWALSVGMHFVLAVFIGLSFFSSQKHSTKKIEAKPFKISLLKTKKIRTVGKPGGSKKVSIGQSVNRPKAPSLSLAKLGAEQSLEMLPKASKKKPALIKRTSKRLGLTNKRLSISNYSYAPSNSKLQLQHLKASRISSIKKSAFDISFEVPEGVSENELNKIEQVFYSFRKRMVQTYLSSFNRSLTKLEKQYPHYLYGIFNRGITLRGKVTFDEQGQISKIKILKGSPDKILDQFFLETLEGMTQLPNPPKDFVIKGKSFSIFYHLIIE